MLSAILLGLSIAQSTPDFNTPTFGVQSYSDSLGVGDLDNDGNPDLVTGNIGSVESWLGDGFGVFTPSGQYPSGLAEHLVVGEFNGDGKMDIIAAGALSISLLKGDGAGGFLAPVSWSFNGQVQDIAAGDLDNDGDLDVVVSTGSGAQALVAGINDGTGGFTLHFTPAGFGIGPIELADMTGDGTLDVVGASLLSPNAVILTGNGSGAFSVVSLNPLNTSKIETIDVADVDQNGDNDVVAGASGLFLTLLGDGTGQLTKVASAVTQNGGFDALLSDLTGDSIPDLVIASTWPSILEGSGVGSFGGVTSVLCGWSRKVVSSDLNNDGRMDLAFLGTERVTVTLQDELGRFGGQDFGNQEDISPHGATLIDVDQDSDLDYVMSVYNEFDLRLYRNDGAGGYAAGPAISLPPELNPTPLRLYSADVNADGNPDLVVPRGSTTSIGLGDGNAGFSGWTSVPATGTPVFGDLDNDGNLDLALHSGTLLLLFQGAGNGQFLSKHNVPILITTGWGDRVVFADVNSDGDLDLTVSAAGIAVRLGDGAFGFSGPTNVALPGLIPDDIQAADLDGDGLVDLTVLNKVNDTATIHVLHNGGVGALTLIGSYGFGPYSQYHTHQAIQDLDGDGDLDVVATADYESGRFSLLFNDGSGGLTIGGTYALRRWTSYLRAEDVDMDGDMDIVGSHLDVVYQNGPTTPCAGTFTEFGDGCHGWGAFVPHLSGHGCPTAGGLLRIGLSGGPGSSVAVLFFGGAAASTPLGFGCSLLLGSVVPLPLPIPLAGPGPGGGQFQLNAYMPPGVTSGTQVFMQVFVPDPTVPSGFAASNGLQMIIQ